jgi:hypothetical protein
MNAGWKEGATVRGWVGGKRIFDCVVNKEGWKEGSKEVKEKEGRKGAF